MDGEKHVLKAGADSLHIFRSIIDPGMVQKDGDTNSGFPDD
jgi:hypothetical protein